MGNRLSGILAELFIDKVVKEIRQNSNTYQPIFRYVDDILIFAKDENDANELCTSFNNNPYGIKFTLELPENLEIAYLDFKVKVDDDGVARFDFYRKPTRKDNFVNAHTTLSNRAIGNIIDNEWRRIPNRCPNKC